MSQRVEIVPIDPYDAVTGLMLPLLLQRVKEFSDGLRYEVPGRMLAKAWGTRLMAMDPTIMAIGFCRGGRMVGHAVATLEAIEDDRWVFIHQCRLDPKVDAGDAVRRALQLAKDWARVNGANRLMMGTHRSDAAWVKKHEAVVARQVMVWPVTGQTQEGTEVA